MTRTFRCSGRSKTALLVHPWCWSWLLAGGVEPISDQQTPPKPNSENHAQQEADDKKVHWQSAASVLAAFTTFVLPAMFGLLGTLMGAFRGIHLKVRENTLAPRDLALIVLGLPLGAVAGVAVGLFFSPSTVHIIGSGSAGGSVGLTASGLAFLGGYGSQSFFAFLDRAIIRAFPASDYSAAGSASSVPRQWDAGSAATVQRTRVLVSLRRSPPETQSAEQT